MLGISAPLPGLVNIFKSSGAAATEANVDGASFFTSRFKEYLLWFDVKPGTNGTYLCGRMKIAGSFPSGASDYTTTLKAQSSGPADYDDGGNVSFFRLTDIAVGISSGATHCRVRGCIHIADPTQTTEFPSLSWWCRYSANAGSPNIVTAMGAANYNIAAGALQGIQLLMNDNSAFDYSWRLQGVRT